MSDAKHNIKIMEAFEEGRIIKFRPIHSSCKSWDCFDNKDGNYGHWNFEDFEYKVVAMPKRIWTGWPDGGHETFAYKKESMPKYCTNYTEYIELNEEVRNKLDMNEN